MSNNAYFEIIIIIVITNITINRDHNVNIVHSVWCTFLHYYQRSQWSVDSKATQLIEMLISSVMKDWEASFVQRQCHDLLQPNFYKKIVVSLVQNTLFRILQRIQTFLNRWTAKEFLFQWKALVSIIHESIFRP